MKREAEIDPNMEIRTITYTIAELTGAGPGCVISQPHAVRYFEHKNPGLIVKQVYGFKMNHSDKTVTIKIRVMKRTYRIGVDMAPVEIPDDKILKPITDPARLLNAGSKGTADLEIHDEFATLNDGVYFKTLGDANARIAELEKENAILKSAIEKFGNGQDFDWNVLARIESLETAITYAIADLPECPDSARDYLVHTQKVGEPEIEGNTNG